MDADYLPRLPFDLKEKQKEFFQCIHREPDRDIVVNLPVGFGKSILYYLLPFFLGVIKGVVNPLVVVISPLTLIHKDQLQKMEKLNIKGFRMDQMGKMEGTNGSIPTDSVKNCSVLLCHPEGLISSEIGKNLLSDGNFISRVVSLVIDECHIVERWGKSFRTAFDKVKTLPAFFPEALIVAMSGTLTKDQLRTLPSALGLVNPLRIEETPDKPNIFLRKKKKAYDADVLQVYEEIFKLECDKLKDDPASYPVTLMFMPLRYISHAAAYLKHLFCTSFPDIPYSVMFSNQDKEILDKTLEILQAENPHIRLILTTAVSGMGFDPPCIDRVIHTCPPRNISQYLQEIGRAGRRGQPAEALLYYSNSDIAACIQDLQQDIRNYCLSETCLRRALLAPFDFEPNDIVGCKCCSICQATCSCPVCSILVPEVVFDLNNEACNDISMYEEVETSVIIPMEE